MRYDCWPISFTSLLLTYTLTLVPDVLGPRLWEFCRLTRSWEAPMFSLFQRWNVWSCSRSLKTNKSLSSVNLSLCPQSRLWVGALWGLRVRGASETSGESCSPSLAFHFLFLLSVCGGDASSWEPSVSGPGAEQEEEAWLPAAEFQRGKCVVRYNTRYTRSDLEMIQRLFFVFLTEGAVFSRIDFAWTYNISAFLTFQLCKFFDVQTFKFNMQ